jgi:hypothetical protein
MVSIRTCRGPVRRLMVASFWLNAGGGVPCSSVLASDAAQLRYVNAVQDNAASWREGMANFDRSVQFLPVNHWRDIPLHEESIPRAHSSGQQRFQEFCDMRARHC